MGSFPPIGMYLAVATTTHDNVDTPADTAQILLIYVRHQAGDGLAPALAENIASSNGWKAVEVEEAAFVSEEAFSGKNAEALADAAAHGWHIVAYAAE